MIRKMIREEGIGCFFKGVLPAVILTVNPVIQYVIYEYLRIKFLNDDGSFSTANIVWISIISKLITTIFTYPMLTVKTLFQTNSKKSTSEIIETILSTIREKGFLELYNGITAKLAQTLINNTITMLAFEKIQGLLKLLLLMYISSKLKGQSLSK